MKKLVSYLGLKKKFLRFQDFNMKNWMVDFFPPISQNFSVENDHFHTYSRAQWFSAMYNTTGIYISSEYFWHSLWRNFALNGTYVNRLYKVLWKNHASKLCFSFATELQQSWLTDYCSTIIYLKKIYSSLMALESNIWRMVQVLVWNVVIHQCSQKNPKKCNLDKVCFKLNWGQSTWYY